MSSPDPDSFGLLAKVLGALTAVGLPIWGARTWLDTRFSKKADKVVTDKCIEHIEKLYDNAEKDRALTRDLHDRAMQRMEENHRHVIGIIMGNRNAP